MACRISVTADCPGSVGPAQGAHIALLDLEELEDHELNHIRAGYEELAEKARADLRRGKKDPGAPEVRPAGPR